MASLGSMASSTLGLWRGTMVLTAAPQPPKALVLYEFEASPYCRAVREALTALHLDAEIRPCPQGGTRFRAEAQRLGGKLQFPMLVDHNAEKVMFESSAIIDHLFLTYGRMDTPSAYRSGTIKPLLSTLASAVRAGRGWKARPSRAPSKALHLWSFESSPYSRLVRERLCELELPYTLHNLGKENWKELGPAMRRILPNPYVPQPGGKRHAFWQKHGRVQLPYLEDPNQDTGLFESARIIEFLESSYAA
ncbi:MAG: glutathione S-transferase N-terminal domain-containing protein [Rhodanobacteraceae bacterium]|nr:glutathione S-transferase N-terminal domain-containing protein [Rhodanobacteraceae bacterium]